MKAKRIVLPILLAGSFGFSASVSSYGDEVSMTCQRSGQGPTWNTNQCTCKAMNGYTITIISEGMCPWRIKFNVKTMTWTK